MGSHGGQQNFPFGYQQDQIHGIGLPQFVTPGPPPGQPLLNAHENQDLDNFFHDFDQNAAANKRFGHGQFDPGPGNEQYYNMPPMFVGSDTALGHRAGINPHQLQAGGFPYSNALMAHEMATPHNLEGGMAGAAYDDPALSNPIIAQLQSAAQMQPVYGPQWQQQHFVPHMMDMQARSQGQQFMSFGSDSHFRPSGYSAPHNPADPDLPNPMQMMDWIEQPTSASTTQPNTQPSSPTWSKKRTFDDYQREQRTRTGPVVPASGQQVNSAQPSPPTSNSRRKRSSIIKSEQATASQPPTPLSNSKPHTPLDPGAMAHEIGGSQEEDAEAEEEEDNAPEQLRSPSPGPWPANTARPPRNTKLPPPPKASRKKKANTNLSGPIKPKPKLQRTSGSQGTPTRVPLTLEQKKANHTNSEQRRRDATARAYAELYDLVPELEDLGKQSTMKKLEVVVAKVLKVKQRVEELRAKLGLDPASGKQHGVANPSILLRNDIQGWRQ